jgi:hypothetical protein
VVPPDPDASGRAACGRLLDELPNKVADQLRRPVVPADALAAAWGDPAIVLRCGVTRPAGFDRASSCVTVDEVDWFIPEEQLERPGDLTMTTVKREQHVEVVVPEEHWPPGTTLADLSDVVRGAIPRLSQCV